MISFARWYLFGFLTKNPAVIRTRRLNRAWVILLHIAAWLLFFSLPLLLHPPVAFENFRPQNSERNFFFQIFFHPLRLDLFHTVNDLLLVAVFYLNAYLLIPQFIRNKKISRFLLVQALIFAGFIFFSSWMFRWYAGLHYGFFNRSWQGNPPWLSDTAFLRRPDGTFRFFTPPTFPDSRRWHYFSLVPSLREIFPYFLILASSIAYRLVIDRIESERLAKERENENLKTELLLLRSQINPHFMFNVLNNMVSLARKKSDQLEPSLIKLSALMRYMYYEVREDKVPLSKEIDYLKNYIEIQEQRFKGSVTVKAEFSAVIKPYVIEPMLLIPFVENAFKHGTGLGENAEIDISLEVKNDVLHFFVSNRINDPAEEKDKTSGIGLANVQRRLKLLYGNRYQLERSMLDNLHIISLQVNLN